MAVSPRRNSPRWIAALIALLGGAPIAHAEAEAGPKKAPVTIEDVREDRLEIDRELIRDFQDMYEEDNEPTLLVLLGMDNRGHDERGHNRNTTAASATRQRGVGSNLSLFDRTGITEQVRAELTGWLSKNRAIDLVDPETMSDLDRRDVLVLAQNNEEDALALLTTKLNAELIYYIKFQPVPAADQVGEVVPFKIIAEIKDARRGRLIDSYALNYRGSTDIRRTREYAVELARWFMTQYNDYVENRPRGLRYAMRVIGFRDDRQMVEARRVIDDIDGIRGKIKANFVANSDDSYGEFTIKYDGDAMDLSYDVQEILGEELGLNITGLDTQGGTILLRIGAPKPPPPMPVWQALQTPDSEKVVDFRSAYNAKDRPAIGVVINWLVRPDQMSAQVQETMPMVLMQGDPRLGNTPQGVDTIGLTDMEGMIMEAFRNMDVTVIDPDQIRKVLSKQAKRVEDLDEATDIASLLSDSDGFDILVYGLANIVGGSDQAERIQYSFKITSLSNGEFLGAQRWPDEEYPSFKIDPHSRQQVGRYLGSRLLGDIYMNNLKSASTMRVRIDNALGQQHVSQLAKALKDDVEGVFQVSSPTFDRGIGTFDLRYTGNYAAILDEVGLLNARMPFTITVKESDPGKIVATMSPKSLPKGDE